MITCEKEQKKDIEIKKDRTYIILVVNVAEYHLWLTEKVSIVGSVMMKVYILTNEGTCGDAWFFIEGVYKTKEKAEVVMDRMEKYADNNLKSKAIIFHGEYKIHEEEVW